MIEQIEKYIKVVKDYFIQVSENGKNLSQSEFVCVFSLGAFLAFLAIAFSWKYLLTLVFGYFVLKTVIGAVKLFDTRKNNT